MVYMSVRTAITLSALGHPAAIFHLSHRSIRRGIEGLSHQLPSMDAVLLGRLHGARRNVLCKAWNPSSRLPLVASTTCREALRARQVTHWCVSSDHILPIFETMLLSQFTASASGESSRSQSRLGWPIGVARTHRHERPTIGATGHILPSASSPIEFRTSQRVCSRVERELSNLASAPRSLSLEPSPAQ